MSPTVSWAQSITQDQALTFSTGVVTDNSSVQTVTLLSNNSFTIDSGIVLTGTPQIGVYQLTGATPSRPIDVAIIVDQQLLGPGQDFTISDFDINAPSTTDINGDARIDIGARLSSSGNGSPYMDSAIFNGLFTISVTVN